MYINIYIYIYIERERERLFTNYIFKLSFEIIWKKIQIID